jgi:hypothetical protein
MSGPVQSDDHWEKSHNEVHRDVTLPETKAKQGHHGRRVLTVLISALLLAFIVWIPIEIWGKYMSGQATPEPAQNQIQTTTPKPSTETPAEVDAEHR